jgi:hypothetical protein
MSAPLFADEEISPQQTVENYFEFFNNEDRASLNASSGNPSSSLSEESLLHILNMVTRWILMG